MERGSIVLIEPVPRIERQEFDLGSFGQIGRLVDDEASGLHASLQRHMITVASRSVAQQARPAYEGESGVHHVCEGRQGAPLGLPSRFLTLPELQKSRDG